MGNTFSNKFKYGLVEENKNDFNRCIFISTKEQIKEHNFKKFTFIVKQDIIIDCFFYIPQRFIYELDYNPFDNNKNCWILYMLHQYLYFTHKHSEEISKEEIDKLLEGFEDYFDIDKICSESNFKNSYKNNKKILSKDIFEKLISSPVYEKDSLNYILQEVIKLSEENQQNKF